MHNKTTYLFFRECKLPRSMLDFYIEGYKKQRPETYTSLEEIRRAIKEQYWNAITNDGYYHYLSFQVPVFDSSDKVYVFTIEEIIEHDVDTVSIVISFEDIYF